MMKMIMSVISLLVLWSASSCSDDTYCASIEREIMDRCVKADSVYSIKLNTLTQFDWDTVYVIRGLSFPEEVEGVIGLKYDKVIQDDHTQYIFTKDRKIVKEFTSECLSRRILVGETRGIVKYPNAATVQIKKQINEGGEYYKFVGLR